MALEYLNLYTLFVENVFGGLLLSGLGLAGILILIGILSRMSPMLIIFIIGLFVASFSIGYVGAVIWIPLFIFAMIYFSLSIVNFINSRR